MYKLKEEIDREILRKYGFRKGNEYPNYEDIICNEYRYEQYWLFPFDKDENEEKVLTIEDDHTPWSVNIQDSGRIWIDCEPYGTYHIDNSDMEEMFYQLGQMLMDGLIEDDYENEDLNE